MPAEEDLRKNLAKANVEKQRHLTDYHESRSKLHDPRVWEAYQEAVRNGTYKPYEYEPRFYVIISPDTLVSTPEALQEMAKMTSPPTVIDTTYTSLHGGNPPAPQMRSDGTPQEVRVGQVSRNEYQEIRSKMDCDMFLLALIDGKPSGVVLVKGPKEVEKRERRKRGNLWTHAH